ncbi:NADP-reducing hydrogenase subunit HndB [Desulfocicer vacuolatum DSM 3385]|uniref:NADP-reducing hydrogenase subunit HndB n=1 Tax=Desulfocicer vacuolatum DSM 3385 TaxID=1121400 RepID=A0A1W1YKR0_9BACT|nr:(2Fe-2S) ferredoxin domain-containing protein [Desulfocicer vacuolatum]SMC36702.1 NADP-reducing hydrogenase subunit HndB [Desulfocicer vacuolatum DSM 3385]
MGKITIEDLKKIKEKTAGIVSQREGKATVTIRVHMGECGIAAGSRDVMTALLEARAEAHRSDIMIVAAGCVEKCRNEPMITIEEKEKATVQYGNLNPEKARQIFTGHILDGRVQENFLMSGD